MSNNNIFNNLFQSNKENQLGNSKIIQNNKNDEINHNEERISYKLTLRKEKIQKTIFDKRGTKPLSDIFNFDFDNASKELNSKDILSGVFYDYMEKAYKENNINDLQKLMKSFHSFINNKQTDNIQFKELLSKGDSSYNIKNNIQKKTFSPLCSLIFEVGLNTDDRAIYIYSFIIILDFSYISNEFCIEIVNSKTLNKIFDRLIHFFPSFMENKNINHQHYKFFKINTENIIGESAAYNFGCIILKLFGNLFLSVDSYKAFEEINFYEKIFFLFNAFDIEIDNKKYINYLFDYIDTLIWLIYNFLKRVKDIEVNYKDKIIMIFPNLLNSIKALLFTQETELLEKMLEIINQIIEMDNIFLQKFVELDIINILSLLFGYLFTSDKNGSEIKLNNDIIDKILTLYIEIFTVDSKYVENLDLSHFSFVYETLLDIYKKNHFNHYCIQDDLVQLLSNLACFEDNEQIVQTFMMNKKIITNIFKNYYEYHKLKTLSFIGNVMSNQLKGVRDFILNLGGFDIINKNICNYDGNSKEVIASSIKILFKLIEVERLFNVNSLLEKLYKTSVPDKLKALYYEKDIQPETEDILKLIIKIFETYENNLDDDK